MNKNNILLASCFLMSLSCLAHAQISSPHKTTAYLLLDKNTSTGVDSIHYLKTTLVPAVHQGNIHMDRLVLSFMNPSMDPHKITQDGQQLQSLLIDGGILPDASPTGTEANDLREAITNLEADHVNVFFAVGGWAYSCKNPEKASSCAANFPLTSDIVTDYTNAHLKTDHLNQIQTPSALSSQDYTSAWVAVAQAFGATGIDLDYEENWFVAETSYFDPILTKKPTWASLPNGPFVMPYVVIKYARWIASLENSTANAHMLATLAAPAAGAFDTHDAIGGSMFWCPIHDQWGNAVCGQASEQDQSHFNIGGNLKGVFYDMAHYEAINKMGYSFTYPDNLFKGLLSRLDSINVMTYDLDDGYDAVGSSWCIGKSEAHQYSSRDPNTDGYKTIDCSIASQTQTIIEMYRDNVLANLSGDKPHLGFGLEAGFPNYPINIDPALPGGGNKDFSHPLYRWNDPFIATSIPLTDFNSSIMNDWLSTHQSSDSLPGVPDKHAAFLIVNPALFKTMQTAGADSVILWSLYNADYNDHLSALSWDKQQLNPLNKIAFGKDYANNGYTQDMLALIFAHAASPEDILQAAFVSYQKTAVSTGK